MNSGAVNVRWVKQEHSHGCGHAALAMLTGQSYGELVALYADPSPDNQGLSAFTLDAHLFDLGYAVCRIYRHRKHHPDRSVWPPSPFADAHLCMVRVTKDAPVSHFVVMLRDGNVLDPLIPEPKRLTDYHDVQNVAGVYKVR